MKDKIRFILSRIAERLWVKPLLVCLLSIAIAFFAQLVDQFATIQKVPEVKTESIMMLLKVISASMLVMAVFAVGAMLAAYQSASNSATPRAFTLVVSDDVSQNALSTFIGAFIFSIVAQVALMNGYYEKAGSFILFIITVFVFVVVIISFIKWVDGIARLGLLSTTIAKVEKAAAEALRRRTEQPFLGGVKGQNLNGGLPVFASTVGYIQRLDMSELQAAAENEDLQIEVAVLPGTFVTPDQPLAYLRGDRCENSEDTIETASIVDAFCIGKNRTFDDDPRFGLITLSEIASRALSPAVNDPGTAIEITGIFVRLFSDFGYATSERKQPRIEFDRVAVPEIPFSDLLEDAFNAIARDGAGTIEVVIRVLKALSTLSAIDNEPMQKAALAAAHRVFAHAEQALQIPSDIATLHAVSEFARSPDP
jgi:uncharacterized membrane protein